MTLSHDLHFQSICSLLAPFLSLPREHLFWVTHRRKSSTPAGSLKNADDIAKALARENSRLESQEGQKPEGNTSGDGQNPTGGGDNMAGGGDNMAGGEMVAQESAQIASNSRESGTDLPSILANATESDLSALVEYAQQDSNLRPTD